MSANEIPNAIDFMLSFTAADPPVIIARTANVADVARTAAGTYVVELVNKIPTGGILAPGRQLQASSQLSSAVTSVSAIEVSGDVVVNVRNLAGALADTTSRIDIACLTYPTVS